MNTTQCCIALSPSHKGALILVRNSGLELLGPGSAIVWTHEKTEQSGEKGRHKSAILPTCRNVRQSDPSLISILLIGDVKLEILDNLSQQKKALWRRVTWLNWLSRIQEISSSVERIESLIQHLNIFFGRDVCQSLPSDLLSKLLGCEERELLWVRDRYFQDWSWDLSTRPPHVSWTYLTAREWQDVMNQTFEQKYSFSSLPGPALLESTLPKSAQWSETLSKMNPFTECDASPLWENSFHLKMV